MLGKVSGRHMCLYLVIYVGEDIWKAHVFVSSNNVGEDIWKAHVFVSSIVCWGRYLEGTCVCI